MQDFARAIILLIKKKNSGIYNIGSNESYTNIELAKSICKYLPPTYETVFDGGSHKLPDQPSVQILY